MISLDCPGNLLDDVAEALVNTVNEVGVSGKGVAAACKRAFPDNFLAYRDECAKGAVRAGRIYVFQRDGFLPPKYVLNLATKKHWRDPSRLEWIVDGLCNLRDEIRRLGISSVAMPLPGCGNGGLSPTMVEPRILEFLSELANVDVRVYGPVPGQVSPTSLPGNDRTSSR